MSYRYIILEVAFYVARTQNVFDCVNCPILDSLWKINEGVTF